MVTPAVISGYFEFISFPTGQAPFLSTAADRVAGRGWDHFYLDGRALGGVKQGRARGKHGLCDEPETYRETQELDAGVQTLLQARLQLTSEWEPVHSPIVCFGFSVAWSPDSALRTPVQRLFLSSSHCKQLHRAGHEQTVISTRGKKRDKLVKGGWTHCV